MVLKRSHSSETVHRSKVLTLDHPRFLQFLRWPFTGKAMQESQWRVTAQWKGLPVVADGGPDAGAPALAKDELICVHRALMPSLSPVPGGSISGTVRSQNGRGEQAGFAAILPLLWVFRTRCFPEVCRSLGH